MSVILKQPIVVDNKPGAGGNILVQKPLFELRQMDTPSAWVTLHQWLLIKLSLVICAMTPRQISLQSY
nr:hypothetical protein [Polynucleobacter necessarius]